MPEEVCWKGGGNESVIEKCRTKNEEYRKCREERIKRKECFCVCWRLGIE